MYMHVIMSLCVSAIIARVGVLSTSSQQLVQDLIVQWVYRVDLYIYINRQNEGTCASVRLCVCVSH